MRRVLPMAVSSLALCLLSHGLPSAEAAAQKEQLDEVVVRGKRVQLAEMRKELVRLEDRFYDRYNELNTRNDFDIHCVNEARTGTRFVKRSCRAVYQDEAFQDEAKVALATRQNIQEQLRVNAPNPVVTGQVPVPATVRIEARLPEFRKNVREVANKDAQLARLLKERAELAARYELLRREILGSGPPEPEAAGMP
jgi:hypothetical protein